MEHMEKKKLTFVIFSVVLLILFGIWLLFRPEAGETGTWIQNPSLSEQEALEGQTEGKTQEGGGEVVVHLTGAVKNPGVLRLKAGDRLIDAVEAAGGLLENADTEGVNLAAVLTDAEKIHIQTIEEAVQSGSSSGSASQKVSLNRATLEELMTLPGIGESIGQAIIDYREKEGPFTKLEDLKAVDRIGDRTFEKLKDAICL